MSGLAREEHAEQVEYLRLVFAAPTRAVALAGQLVELPELRRNLALLHIAEHHPMVVEAAIGALRGAGCMACGHDEHDPGDCLIAMVSAEGFDGSYCCCGSPGPAPVVLQGQELVDALEDMARARERGE